MTGLWLCLLGRHFFALSHLAYGALAGFAAGCIVAEAAGVFNFTFKVFVIAACGVVGGVLWLCQWLLLGWPRLSLVLPGLMMGVIPAGALLFSPAMNTATFIPNGSFWSTAFGELDMRVTLNLRLLT